VSKIDEDNALMIELRNEEIPWENGRMARKMPWTMDVPHLVPKTARYHTAATGGSTGKGCVLKPHRTACGMLMDA
jgi:hypothetical protein